MKQLDVNDTVLTNILVVRLTTQKFMRGDSINFTKIITPLKRKSTLSISDLICDLEMDEIINIHEVPDGVYELTATNISRDWETNTIDDWDLILKEYKD